MHKVRELLNRVYPVNIIKVESVTDEIFRCTAEEDNYFARITNYKSFDEQLEEVKYTDFLYEEGLGVSPTISSVNGKVVERITLEHNETLTVLYKSAPGKHLSRNKWNADVLKVLGRQIGKLHRLSKKFEEQQTIRYINDWQDSGRLSFEIRGDI